MRSWMSTAEPHNRLAAAQTLNAIAARAAVSDAGVPQDLGSNRSDRSEALKSIADGQYSNTKQTAKTAPSGGSAVVAAAESWTSFPQRGSTTDAGRLYWSNMPFVLQAVQCDSQGCHNRDRLSVTVTVDPGAITSKLSWKDKSLMGNTGAFTNVHFDGIPYCLGDMRPCGFAHSENNIRTAYYWYVSNTYAANGSSLGHAVNFWAQCVKCNNWYRDRARTGKSSCASSSNECRY